MFKHNVYIFWQYHPSLPPSNFQTACHIQSHRIIDKVNILTFMDWTHSHQLPYCKLFWRRTMMDKLIFALINIISQIEFTELNLYWTQNFTLYSALPLNQRRAWWIQKVLEDVAMILKIISWAAFLENASQFLFRWNDSLMNPPMNWKSLELL